MFSTILHINRDSVHSRSLHRSASTPPASLSRRALLVLLALHLLLLVSVFFTYRHDMYAWDIDLASVEAAQVPGLVLVTTEEGYLELGVEGGYDGTVLTRPGVYADAGDYELRLTYECTTDGAVSVSSPSWLGEDNALGKVFAAAPLPAGESEVSLPFTLSREAADLTVSIDYHGGSMIVKSLTLASPRRFADAPLTLALLLLCEGVGAWLWRRGRRTGRMQALQNYLLALLFAALAILPLCDDFGFWMHDLNCHLDRLRGLSYWMEHFSWKQPVPRISEPSWGGAGYPWPVFYPQLFLTVPALLHTLGGSLLFCYKALLFLAHFMTAIFSLLSFGALSGSRKVALVGSALYTFSLYRLMDCYTRFAAGEFLAMAFLPLLFWSLYEVVRGDRRRWGWLVLSMTGILQSHLLTTAMCVYFGVLFVVVSLPRLVREPRRLATLLGAGALTVLLNLWFLLPLLQGSALPLRVLTEGQDANLYLTAVYPSQLFAPFADSQGLNLPLGTVQSEMPLTVGVLPLFGLLLYGALSLRRSDALRQKGRGGLLFTVCGLLALWLSSTLFPWRETYRFFPTLQYVWRFLAFASVFLSYTTAVALNAALTAVGERIALTPTAPAAAGSGPASDAIGSPPSASGSAAAGGAPLLSLTPRSRTLLTRCGAFLCAALAVVFALPYLTSLQKADAIGREQMEGSFGADHLYQYAAASYDGAPQITASDDVTLTVSGLQREGTQLRASVTVSVTSAGKQDGTADAQGDTTGGAQNKTPDAQSDTEGGAQTETPDAQNDTADDTQNTLPDTQDAAPWVDLPVRFFPGYHLVDENTGEEIPIRLGKSGFVRFDALPGNTQLYLYYEESPLWRLADLISLGALLGVASYGGRRFYRKRKMQKPETMRR